MAERPVFLPGSDTGALAVERSFSFDWAPGFSDVQKKRNVASLHAAANRAGLDPVLEVSTKSDLETGRALSAFSLRVEIGCASYPLESVYQGAKVFARSGPHPEIFSHTPRDAKKVVRQFANEAVIGFRLDGRDFPTLPRTAFYDWLYMRALKDRAGWIEREVARFAGFTDIEFAPKRQINCQARSLAGYVTLMRRGTLDHAIADFDAFAGMLAR